MFKLIIIIDDVDIETKTDQSQKSILCTSFTKTSSDFNPYHWKDYQVDYWQKKHKNPPTRAIYDFHQHNRIIDWNRSLPRLISRSLIQFPRSKKVNKLNDENKK